MVVSVFGCAYVRVLVLVVVVVGGGLSGCHQRIKNGTSTAADEAELQYHVLLVRLLSISTEGKNGVAETTCQNLLTTDDVLAHMKVGLWAEEALGMSTRCDRCVIPS